MRTGIYVAVPVMLLLAVLQTAVLPRFSILGLVPQLSFLVALSWALLRGLEEGLAWAFIAGFSLDLFSIGPLGTTAIAYMTAVFVVMMLMRVLPENRFFIPVVMTALGSAVALFVYLLFVRLLGFASSLETAVSLAPLIILNAGFMLPVYWLIYSLDRLIHPRRVEL
ncbi:MAG: rod shape-determining protein MreD [Ardenticatenaceae bacterium]|nr:rod shape-determining protein MreD [Ardenticatenaceae bacterium]MCB8986331.1 rod shape-determining protein MreD [Ardenticatenaceae bacterium]